MILIFLLWHATSMPAQASIFGEENIPLLKLVAGQITELRELSSALGVAKDNQTLLLKINEGIGQVTQQLDQLDEILERSKKLNPEAVRKISDLTRLLEETKSLKGDLESAVNAKLALTQEAVEKSSLQSEGSYSVGQRLIETAVFLANEAKTASPGRATQLSATANISQMIATGTLLQSLSHLTELEAISLELKRAELKAGLLEESARQQSAKSFLERRKN